MQAYIFRAGAPRVKWMFSRIRVCILTWIMVLICERVKLAFVVIFN